MALAPGLQRIDHGAQALTGLRQAILHPRRHLGIDFSDDQPVILQRAELFRQHALGDSGHKPAQLAEALGTVLQVEQDHPLPLAVDQIKRRLDRAAGPMRKIPPLHEVFPIVSKQGLYPSIYSTCQVGASATTRHSFKIKIRSPAMKAVGYKKSLPIAATDALIDFETAKPEPRSRDLRVAVKAISVNPVDYKVRKRAAPPEG